MGEIAPLLTGLVAFTLVILAMDALIFGAPTVATSLFGAAVVALLAPRLARSRKRATMK
jgi:hypothetical protein